MCGINKKCSCGCKKDIKESREMKKFTILATDLDGSLENIIKALQTRGNTGHSFSVSMDEDSDDGGEIFGWDGDGADYIKSIEVEKVVDEEKKNKEEKKDDKDVLDETEDDDAEYYRREAKALARNGYRREAQKFFAKAKLARDGKLVDGELQEAKANMKLSSNTKRELVKQAKTALDAIYAIYNVCEKQDISTAAFMRNLDKAFEGSNELLTLLVVQDSVDKK